MADEQPSRRFRLCSRAACRRLGILAVVISVGLAWCYTAMIRMPGRSHSGPLPPLTQSQRALAAALEADVRTIASEAGSRSLFYPRKLADAATHIHTRLESMGFTDRREIYCEGGASTPNIEVTISGSALASEFIVIGAHYDAFQGTPGADDNASGVAAALALAESLRDASPQRTIRIVLFVNEEPPMFQTSQMGSWVCAREYRARNDNVVAMLSLESIGYYSARPGSQQYPPPLNLIYPSAGDFIAFVSNTTNAPLVRRVVRLFREKAAFPSEGAALPGAIPGVGWSDHWAFWQEDYPALMVTGTAPFRNPNYHNPTDTPETLDYERLARVTDGLRAVILELANAP